MRYKLVIFDFDGTLADSFPWFLSIINDVADKYRFKRIDVTRLDELRSCSARELIARLGLPMWKVPLVAGHMRRLMMESAGDISLVDGAEPVLETLARQGIDMALVTSNTYHNVCAVLGTANVERIRYLECGTSIFGKKARFRKLLKMTGVTSDEVICIGDEIRDAQAARAVGVDFIAVSWGYNDSDALQAHAPFKVLRSFDEFLVALHEGRHREA